MYLLLFINDEAPNSLFGNELSLTTLEASLSLILWRKTVEKVLEDEEGVIVVEFFTTPYQTSLI